MLEVNSQAWTSFDKKNYYNYFDIYIYKCLKEGCVNCTYGTIDTEKCFKCDFGYMNKNQDCYKNEFL